MTPPLLRLFRIVAFGNIVLAALTWSTWFEGNERHAGFADALFGWLRFAGFRADLVWLVLSIPAFAAVSMFFFNRASETPPERKDARLGVIAALASCAAIFHMVFSGLLFFG
jgi:hypothetical protein